MNLLYQKHFKRQKLQHQNQNKSKNQRKNPTHTKKLQSYDHPAWLIDVYVDIWKQHNESDSDDEDAIFHCITMKELLSRPIDPESPRWYFIEMKNLELLRDYETRYICWSTIRDELCEQLNKKHKNNIYGFHNMAVLSFLLHEPDAAFRAINLLIESVFHPTLLRTAAYFYIQMNQLNHAAAILYHILKKQEDIDWHALYLSMRLFSKMIDEKVDQQKLVSTKDHEQLAKYLIRDKPSTSSLFQSVMSYFGIAHKDDTLVDQDLASEITEMEDFRKCIMKAICTYNPDNHLYRLWMLYWDQRRTNKSSSLVENKVVDDVCSVVCYNTYLATRK
jgi:hypothetical protein